MCIRDSSLHYAHAIAISLEQGGIVGRPYALLARLLMGVNQGRSPKTLRSLYRPEPPPLGCLQHPAALDFLNGIHDRHRGYHALAVAFPQGSYGALEKGGG